ncbi:zinc-binding alcohol dehydrogenase family protein [Catenuloplanes sp. NPDC051500]|uniref:zinc-binding alcohol dehydrogenase family protein n=1 Tax=Catenuloplanes sp. NPDC051500 TaxID=3363959 RepID=UPI00378C52F9
MQAAQMFSFGAPDVLRVTEVGRPSPGPGEVLVAVGASSVNGHDTLIRAGALTIASGRRFPIGTGLDFAGVVAETGPGVDLRAGLPVWGLVHPRGRHAVAGAAEYVVVPANRVGALPGGLSMVDAAALVVPGITALAALGPATRLARGESVLVRGAAGGVGTAVTQLARAMGGTVTALARSSQREFLTGLGAARVLDYHEVTPAELDAFDVIVDTVGTELGAYRRRLAKGGRMVTVALSGPAIAAIAASAVYGPRRIRAFSANPLTPELDELARYVAAGSVRPVVDQVFPLADIAAAHHAFARRGVQGRQVVTVTAD